MFLSLSLVIISDFSVGCRLVVATANLNHTHSFSLLLFFESVTLLCLRHFLVVVNILFDVISSFLLMLLFEIIDSCVFIFKMLSVILLSAVVLLLNFRSTVLSKVVVTVVRFGAQLIPAFPYRSLAFIHPRPSVIFARHLG